MSHKSAMDLKRRAQSALTSSPVYPLRELNVESRDDALLITGSAGSFYYKQLAQEAVRAAVGAVELVNSVQVQPQA